MTLVLNNGDIARLLDMKSCVEALEAAYRDLGQGEAANRPKTYLVVPLKPGLSYSYCTMEGADRRLGVVAIRMKSDMNEWQTAYGMKRGEKWASAPGKFCGLVLLFSAHNGELLAILNDGLIQHLRVGATSGVAARYMARPEASTLGILGSGGQARSHARAFAAVRPLKKIKVYSPNPGHREAFADEMANVLGLEVKTVSEARAAVTGSDLVATCTNSLEPVLKGEWLEPGCHAASVNANTELDPGFFNHVDVVIKHQTLNTPYYLVGTEEEARLAPRSFKEGAALPPADVPTLAELVLGRVSGRTRPEQVTYFSNNEGNGLQFAATAALAYQRALERGVGRELPTDWFLQDIRD